MAKKSSRSIWLWPFLGLILIIWVVLLKMSPDLRATMSLGIALGTWYNLSIVLLLLFMFVAIISITKQFQELHAGIGGDDGEEVLMAEIVDDDDDTGAEKVVEIESEKMSPGARKAEASLKGATAGCKMVYEYPRNVSRGVHVDTIVKPSEEMMIKIRTLVAEDNEV